MRRNVIAPFYVPADGPAAQSEEAGHFSPPGDHVNYSPLTARIISSRANVGSGDRRLLIDLTGFEKLSYAGPGNAEDFYNFRLFVLRIDVLQTANFPDDGDRSVY